MIKGFRQIVSLTALSRVFGLVRDMTFSYYFGAGSLMDSWVIAFRIPNLARRLFGEGAASASFIPVYSEQLHKDPRSAAKLANTVVSVIFVLLSAIVLLGWIIIFTWRHFGASNSETKFILSLSAAMLPYMLMVCTVAILAGILNVHSHFAAPASAPVILNIFIISGTVLSGSVMGIPPNQQVFVIAIAVLLAGLAQIAIQFVPLRTCGVSIKPAWDVHSQAFKKIIMLMGPMIVGLTVTQINTLADDIIAWCFSGSPEKGDAFTILGTVIDYPLKRGSVSYLYYSQRLYQFPLGVLGISLATAIFPVMSIDAAKGDFEALCKTISKGIKGALFVALPATAGLFLVGRQLTSVILEHGKFSEDAVQKTGVTLAFYAVGLCGYFSQQIVTRGFYAMQDSKMPAKTAVVAVCLNIILNLTLIWYMGTAGLALSTAICSYLQVFILIAVLRKRMAHPIMSGFVNVLIKTIIATAIMSFISWATLYAMRSMGPDRISNLLRLAAVVSVASTSYYFASKILRNDMVAIVTGKMK